MERCKLLRKLFPSQEMADYLAGQELSDEVLIEIIAGAPIALQEKLGILRSLIRQENDPFDRLAHEINEALHALNTNPGEFFYVKNGWPDYDVGEADIDPMEPYPDLERAICGINQFLKEEREIYQDYMEEEECNEDSCYWFILEKWTLSKEGKYVCPYNYIVVNGEVLYFEKGAYEGLCLSNLPYSSVNLNLPIPFHPGDIVRLDCVPFAFRANAVLLEVGNNSGCCSVQAMFRNENGTWSVGALKHSHVFPNFYEPLFSPLYRLSTVQEELANEEKILEEVSQFVAGSDKRGYALWMEFLHKNNSDKRNSELSEAEIRAFIRREMSKELVLMNYNNTERET